MRIQIATLLLLAGCSSHTSNEQQLKAAANQSMPMAAQVLNGAAENGTAPQVAMNEAAQAEASNTSATAPPRLQARPNTAQNPNPQRAGEPPEKVVANGP